MSSRLLKRNEGSTACLERACNSVKSLRFQGIRSVEYWDAKGRDLVLAVEPS
jgi:hypothetical protein